MIVEAICHDDNGYEWVSCPNCGEIKLGNFVPSGCEKCRAIFSNTDEHKPTNGDRIRAILADEEELAKSRIRRGDLFYTSIDIPNALFECLNDALEAEVAWLRQEASDCP